MKRFDFDFDFRKALYPVVKAMNMAVREAEEFQGRIDSLEKIKKETEMNKKCEWKDGKFKPCDGFDGSVSSAVYFDGINRKHNYICESCHCVIDKPEPKVIIKKSGDTWVARYEGIDYLWMRPELPTSCNTEWKPISEIEITDKIAKLRPMIKIDGVICKLVGALDGGYHTTYGHYPPEFDIQLANVIDLEPLNER